MKRVFVGDAVEITVIIICDELKTYLRFINVERAYIEYNFIIS